MHTAQTLAKIPLMLNHIWMTTTTCDSLRIRRSNERGHFTHGWLDTRHTFSFGDYYDPAHMGFRSLRVINDDFIAPGSGFPTHPHRDMEIFSYVLEGRLAHEDSMGNRRELKPGEIQLMRAGSGVTHSEFNPSSTERVHILQIWIQPEKRGLTPAYTEWQPSAGTRSPKTLIISRDGRDDSAHIAQDADVYRILTSEPHTSITHEIRADRGIWLHVIQGEAHIGDVRLTPGDAASIEKPMTLKLTSGSEPLEALLFDLR
jgi:redox-sensitive bicupin YhaK (pirin superfamily)